MAKKAKKKDVKKKPVDAKKSKKKVESADDFDTDHAAANKYKAAEILLFQRISDAFDDLLEVQKSIVLLEEQVPPIQFRAAVTIVALTKFLSFKYGCFDSILALLNVVNIPPEQLNEVTKAALDSTNVAEDQVLSKEDNESAAGDIQST